MNYKCNFCKINKTDNFHITFVEKLKTANIISKNYPQMCPSCYSTFSSVKKLEQFLHNNDINCDKCGNKLYHFEILFDGSGHTAYCDCMSCGEEHSISMIDNGVFEIKQRKHVESPSELHELIQ